MKDSFNKFEYSNSKDYWVKRYETGGNSGAGSRGRLRKFKAQVLNAFVKIKNIQTVIEFGCGDGEQLQLAIYPKYIGIDVSPLAIQKCQLLFKDDSTKQFYLPSEVNIIANSVELSLALDVLCHLVEDDIWTAFVRDLFAASKQWVIIYDTDRNDPLTTTQRYRNFTKWIKENIEGWSLVKRIPNSFPEIGGKASDITTSADFFIFKKE